MPSYNLDPALGICGYSNGAPAASAYIRMDSALSWGLANGENAWFNPQNADTYFNGALRFIATGVTGITIRAYQNGAWVRVFIDGVYDPASNQLSGAGGYGNLALSFTAPSDGLPHVYKIVGGRWLVMNTLTLTFGAGGAISTAPLADAPMIVIYGDSRSAGTNVTDATLTFNLRIAGPLKAQVYTSALGGTGVRNFTGIAGTCGNSSAESRTANITSSSLIWPTATNLYYLIMYAVNDLINNCGTYASGPFIASYENMLNAIIAAQPNARIICEGVFKSATSGTGSDVSGINADIQTAIAAVANPKVYYRHGVADVMDGSAGLHPNDAAQAMIATALVSDLLTVLNISGRRASRVPRVGTRCLQGAA